jgi:hypothetical protein
MTPMQVLLWMFAAALEADAAGAALRARRRVNLYARRCDLEATRIVFVQHVYARR